jgi:hypothetical protein
MNNNFEVGQLAICISDNFPHVAEYSKTKTDTIINKPALRGVYEIAEILGDYLRFDEFDIKDEFGNVLVFNWFKYDRFAVLQVVETLLNEEKKHFLDLKHKGLQPLLYIDKVPFLDFGHKKGRRGRQRKENKYF